MDEIVADHPEYEPVDHFGSNNRLIRRNWLVKFHPVDAPADERAYCCESTHGHTTQANAKRCFAANLARRQKAS